MPTVERLAREGAWTRELVVTFPSITFSSHASIATGTTPDEHGIMLNEYYDRKRDRTYSWAGSSFLLQREAIWNTATRQGVRTAVLHWPLSYMQRGRSRAAYFERRYNYALDDEERLIEMLDVWEQDDGDEPLRFLLGYNVDPDTYGHRFGPESDDMLPTLEEVDRRLAAFVTRMVELFEDKSEPGDSLYFFLTTDHGMAEVHTLVNIDLLTGLADHEEVLIFTSGNMGLVYLDGIEPIDERKAVEDEVMKRLARHDFLEAYRLADLPEAWAYGHPDRAGDIVIALDMGYAFNRRAREVTAPRSRVGGAVGMHGYDPEEPDMWGYSVFWRYPEPLGGLDLGRVCALQLHPTAAAVLGVEPSRDAKAPVIEPLLEGLAWPADE